MSEAHEHVAVGSYTNLRVTRAVCRLRYVVMPEVTCFSNAVYVDSMLRLVEAGARGEQRERARWRAPVAWHNLDRIVELAREAKCDAPTLRVLIDAIETMKRALAERIGCTRVHAEEQVR